MLHSSVRRIASDRHSSQGPSRALSDLAVNSSFTGTKCDNSAGARRTVTNRGGICFVATGRQSYRVSVECRGGLNIGYSVRMNNSQSARQATMSPSSRSQQLRTGELKANDVAYFHLRQRKTDCSNPYLYKRHGPGACVHVDTGKAWGSSSVSF